MTQLDVLLEVCETLNQLGIDYMLTGAYAVSFYGRPRTTQDIDLVVTISGEEVKNLYSKFKDLFYIDEESIKEAIREKSMFNIIHNETLDKIDFWLLKDNEFDKVRFSRRRKEEIKGKAVFISSPEDLILTKLDWYKKSDLQKHYNDVLGIFEVQTGKLDLDYIRKWAEVLFLIEIVEEIIKE